MDGVGVLKLTPRAKQSAAPPDWREERSWVDRARRNDEAALRWLLNRYRPRALRLAAGILRRPAEAEDVVQDAFIQAFQRLNQLKDSRQFGGWLLSIVSRKCLDRTRTADWATEVGSAPEQSTTGPAAEVTTRVLVEQLLNELPPDQRAALMLREAEELDYETIAEVLEIPVGTVRSRLHTARQRFRELYLAALSDEP